MTNKIIKQSNTNFSKIKIKASARTINKNKIIVQYKNTNKILIISPA